MKKPSLARLKKKAWALWSRHRRRTAADFRGYAICYTCRKKFPWKDMHLGHYKHRKLDFDPINTNPQCAQCNTYGHGMLDLYTLHLIEDYGIEAIKDLQRRAEKVHKYTREELEAIIKKYT